MKERGEGVAVNDLLGCVVAYRHLTISFHRKFSQMEGLSVPTGKLVKLVKVNGLVVGITRESIVEPQGFINEKIGKLLSLNGLGCNKKQCSRKWQQVNYLQIAESL